MDHLPIFDLDDEYMAYVSYLHMERKYRPLIQPAPTNDAIESQNGSMSLPSPILQPTQEVLQNSIEDTADTTTLAGDEDENSPPTPKARPAMSDNTISHKSEKYLRNDTSIPTKAPQIPVSATVHDLNSDDEQEQLLPSTLPDSEEQESPPALPKKMIKQQHPPANISHRYSNGE